MQDIRNIAIIAHVDHGKTTLVDKMLMAGHLFRDNQNTGELILDNNDLERERGITILSKNVSINYKGTKINIIDTPGHADFGGEVERVLNMADGCLLLVDAFEGPMPQTRFVLQKAIQMGLIPVVVINKVDKPNCRPEEVSEMVFDLMFNLNATEEQLNFPVVYGSAKQGWMSDDWQKPTDDITAVLDAIVKYIPAPTVYEGNTQMLITSLDYSSYVGRIAIGRVHRGTIREGQEIALCKRDGSVAKQRIKELHTFEGMGRKKVQEVASGDICAIMGLEGFEIGDTISVPENPEPLPRIAIDEPTMSMTFTINDSPFFGQDGKYVTSRHIWERLQRELDRNRLENDMQLAFNLFNQTSQKLQAAEAKVQDVTPVFAVVDPATVPVAPSGPKKKLIALMWTLAFFVLGSLISCRSLIFTSRFKRKVEREAALQRKARRKLREKMLRRRKGKGEEREETPVVEEIIIEDTHSDSPYIPEEDIARCLHEGNPPAEIDREDDSRFRPRDDEQ